MYFIIVTSTRSAHTKKTHPACARFITSSFVSEGWVSEKNNELLELRMEENILHPSAVGASSQCSGLYSHDFSGFSPSCKKNAEHDEHDWELRFQAFGSKCQGSELSSRKVLADWIAFYLKSCSLQSTQPQNVLLYISAVQLYYSLKYNLQLLTWALDALRDHPHRSTDSVCYKNGMESFVFFQH